MMKYKDENFALELISIADEIIASGDNNGNEEKLARLLRTMAIEFDISPKARAKCGVLLAKLGDYREGVGVSQ